MYNAKCRTLNSRSGFTLIELMVVITIIGVVFGVILTSATQIRKNARDTQRKSDLAKIQSALQNYYADESFYPSCLTLGGSIINTTTGCNGAGSTITYLNPVPNDPLTSSGALSYCYQPLTSSGGSTCDNTSPTPSGRCNYYNLYANLENSTGNSYPGVCGKTYNYQVSAP